MIQKKHWQKRIDVFFYRREVPFQGNDLTQGSIHATYFFCFFFSLCLGDGIAYSMHLFGFCLCDKMLYLWSERYRKFLFGRSGDSERDILMWRFFQRYFLGVVGFGDHLLVKCLCIYWKSCWFDSYQQHTWSSKAEEDWFDTQKQYLIVFGGVQSIQQFLHERKKEIIKFSFSQSIMIFFFLSKNCVVFLYIIFTFPNLIGSCESLSMLWFWKYLVHIFVCLCCHGS